MNLLNSLEDTALVIHNLVKQKKDVNIFIHQDCVFDPYIIRSSKIRRKDGMIVFDLISRKEPIVFNPKSLIRYFFS